MDHQMPLNPMFLERFERIQKTIALEPVGEVPVCFMGSAFAPRWLGMTIAEYCENPESSARVNLEAAKKLDVDCVNLAPAGRITPLLTAIWMSRLGVPGRDLPADSLWQVREAEVMTVEDYDTILNMGWDAFYGSYLPRVIDMQEFGMSMGVMAQLTPIVQQQYREAGIVIICDAPMGMPNIPFEYLCGGRSMQKFFIDLYRMPDKIKAVMDVIQASELAKIRNAPPFGGIRGTWVGGWRSASALVAPRLWNKFVWPYIVEQVEACVSMGITPVLHWDQDWTRDLGRLTDLPAKKCIMNPDGMTDMKKFKEVAGDHMAMMGDIPASLLSAGTPDDVYKYVKEQVELFEGRGLILTPGCDAPINTKPENMEAFVAAAREYGKVAQPA